MHSSTGAYQPFGLSFTHLRTRDFSELLAQRPLGRGEGVRMIATANVDHIVRLQDDAEFQAAYRFAWQVTADGMPIFLYARARGVPVQERVTGADIFTALMSELAVDRHRPFFVVPSEAVGLKLVECLAARGFSPSEVSYVCPPRGFEADERFSYALTARIREHRTTHLFMCVGAPKSEIWIYKHREKLGDCYALPVGAAAEFFVGEKKRAPRWQQSIGMEWSWRLLQEPKRLFRRYLINSWRIFKIVLMDIIQNPRAATRTAASATHAT